MLILTPAAPGAADGLYEFAKLSTKLIPIFDVFTDIVLKNYRMLKDARTVYRNENMR